MSPPFVQNFFVLNWIFSLPQDTSRVRFELVTNSFYSVGNAIVLNADLRHHLHGNMNMIRSSSNCVQLPTTLFGVFPNYVFDSCAMLW